jgi:hypothetical protein
LTIFDHEYVVGWGRARQVRRFTVRFRTLPVASMVRRLNRAGFDIEAVSGGYAGEVLEAASGTWLIVARRR